MDDELPPPHRFAPTQVKARASLEIDLTSREIRTVLWATGFRPDHSWLEIPGARNNATWTTMAAWSPAPPDSTSSASRCSAPRASTYIHGAASDTEAIADHLRCFLGSQRQ